MRGRSSHALQADCPRRVEDDAFPRAMIAILLKETEMQVLQCESGETIELLLEKLGGCMCFMFTDINLSGSVTGKR